MTERLEGVWASVPNFFEQPQAVELGISVWFVCFVCYVSVNKRDWETREKRADELVGQAISWETFAWLPAHHRKRCMIKVSMVR